ncbi:hypothetical protein GCM10023079_08530 [Streptomyces chitinivorans]
MFAPDRPRPPHARTRTRTRTRSGARCEESATAPKAHADDHENLLQWPKIFRPTPFPGRNGAWSHTVGI